MFNTEQSWKMREPEKVLALIKEIGVSRLGYWDGCCCSHFSIRNVNVSISCGKGGEQAVRVSSRSSDYGDVDHGDPELLRPIMDEVVRQLNEQSGRGGKFAEYFHP